MSVQSQIDRINGLVVESYKRVKAKGGTNTSAELLANLPDAIDSIPEGVKLPTLTNPATSADMVEGMELIDQNGNIVTGAIPIRELSDVEIDGDTVRCPEGYYPESFEVSIKKPMLYESGNQYTEITGGWGSSGWSSGFSSYSISAPTIDTSGITLKGAGTSKLVPAGTGNKIDLRNVTTLYVTVDSYGITNPYETCAFAVNREKKVAPTGTGYTMDAMVKITGVGEIPLNVENIDEGYVVAFIHSGSATVRITKIRME